MSFETSHSPNNPNRTFHGLHDPLPFPDFDTSSDHILLSPPGVDYDFDPDFDTQAQRDASRIAWEAMVQRSKERRSLAS
jgi:hypothetical protein